MGNNLDLFIEQIAELDLNHTVQARFDISNSSTQCKLSSRMT
jgi:hypothetical protein